VIKKRIIQTGTTRRRDRQQMENFYCAAIYELLKAEIHDQAYVKLRHQKAKIVRLNNAPHQRHYIDTEENDTLEGEQPTLYQLLRQRKRQKARLIEHLQDGEGNYKSAPMDIMRVFIAFMTEQKGDEIDRS
jgi:hypothetical protein